MLGAARGYFATGATRQLGERKAVLARLRDWIRAHDGDICDALYADLHKAPFESWASEIGVVVDEIDYALRHLDEWSRPVSMHSNIKVAPARAVKHPEPYGVALIMAPWNYPFMLTIDPLVAAVAAGNCAVLKPSNYSAATSDVIARMCAEVFEPGHVGTVLGGRDQNTALLDQNFDLIFFTGSSGVGTVVLQAAAKHLTPVVLELGGKSPCIVDPTASVKLAAKRIVWGKFLNAGQTCVAPDYVLAHESIVDELIAEMTHWIGKFYGDAMTNSDYPHIINDRSFQRLTALIDPAKVVCGGRSDAATRCIEPTIMRDVTMTDPVMAQEIFGPVLPVLTWSEPDDVLGMVAQRPQPLACYVFSDDDATQRLFMNHIAFGGGCINDCVVHVATELPFGGVGNSGMGNYHGKAGFDTFTHYKSVLDRSKIDVPLRYPPYSRAKLEFIKHL